MWFLAIGVLFLAGKLLAFGPMAAWSWWVVAAPFGLAVAWWSYADNTGYTKRKAMEKERAKKQARRDAQRVELGIDKHRR